MSWDVIINQTVAAFMLPPGGNILAVVIALMLFKRYKRSAIIICFLSFSSLWLLSLPVIADKLLAALEPANAINSVKIKQLNLPGETKRAIVVLAGGRLSLAPEYGDIDTVNADTLQRVQYASWLQKRTNLPVLLSGGSVHNEATAEAVLMNQAMLANFGIAPKWIESQSKNTAENALYSAHILRQNDISEILLVTQAWHMSRAVQAFEHVGIKVIPAATAFNNQRANRTRWTDFLPSAKGLADSNKAIHEYLGSFWFHLRY